MVIICCQKLIARLARKSEKFERISQDKLAVLVQDGVMQLDNMQQTRISRERLFAQLRSMQLRHPGKVKRLYLEAGGTFSLVEAPDSPPGLAVLPEWDQEIIARLQIDREYLACNSCGTLARTAAVAGKEHCPHCEETEWKPAVHA